MPLIWPATSLRNFTPSSTAFGSPLSTLVGVTELLQMVTGPRFAAAAVLNDQLTGAAITLPLASWAPLTVAVYVMELARGALGVSVTVWFVSLYETVAAKVLLLLSLRT